jgi:hypothetical protein
MKQKREKLIFLKKISFQVILGTAKKRTLLNKKNQNLH